MISSFAQWVGVGSEAFVRNRDVCSVSQRPSLMPTQEMTLFPSLRWSKSFSSSELISTIHSSDRDELIRRLGTGAK